MRPALALPSVTVPSVFRGVGLGPYPRCVVLVWRPRSVAACSLGRETSGETPVDTASIFSAADLIGRVRRRSRTGPAVLCHRWRQLSGSAMKRPSPNCAASHHNQPAAGTARKMPGRPAARQPGPAPGHRMSARCADSHKAGGALAVQTRWPRSSQRKGSRPSS